MDFEITFSDNSSKAYESAKYKIGDANGILTVTEGDDVFTFAPHAWKRVQTKKKAGGTAQIW